jgi:hypothetical protein
MLSGSVKAVESSRCRRLDAVRKSSCGLEVEAEVELEVEVEVEVEVEREVTVGYLRSEITSSDGLCCRQQKCKTYSKYTGLDLILYPLNTFEHTLEQNWILFPLAVQCVAALGGLGIGAACWGECWVVRPGGLTSREVSS